MRRKVLQDFANTVCQYYVDMGGCQDAAAFACYGSGSILIDFLSGNCTFDGQPILALRSSKFLKEWLEGRFAAHHIAVQEIVLAKMKVTAVVSNVKLGHSSWHIDFGSALYEFHCQSEITTTEKSYYGQMSGVHAWGFQKKNCDSLCRLPEGG